jgi:hypothetical protein
MAGRWAKKKQQSTFIHTKKSKYVLLFVIKKECDQNNSGKNDLCLEGAVPPAPEPEWKLPQKGGPKARWAPRKRGNEVAKNSEGRKPRRNAENAKKNRIKIIKD